MLQGKDLPSRYIYSRLKKKNKNKNKLTISKFYTYPQYQIRDLIN